MQFSSIYLEIIQLHFCHLDRHLRRFIIKRVEDEPKILLNKDDESVVDNKMINIFEESFDKINLLDFVNNDELNFSINNDFFNFDKNGFLLNENKDTFSMNNINMSKTIREDKNIFKLEKPKNKVIKKKISPTKLFIQSLLGLNLSSYQVNRIIKLIKTSWIFGIYSLLNDKLNCLFIEYRIKAEGFIFEFLYFKTLLIETDNSEKNLSILDIHIKDLVMGTINNSNNNKKINKLQNNILKNNKNLIEFLHKIINDKEYQNNERLIKEVKNILIILEEKISFFVDAVWNTKCNEIEKEFQKFCSKAILINKFKKSKEIIKIIISIIEVDYPEKIKKIKKKSNKEKTFTNLYTNYLSEFEDEKNGLKNNIDKIIDKFLEISKKEKYELYFKKKINK